MTFNVGRFDSTDKKTRKDLLKGSHRMGKLLVNAALGE